MRAFFGALLLFFSASTAKASTDEQLSSKAELSPFFDRIQLRLESYAALHNAGARMSTVARPSSVEKRSLVSSAAPFYVVRGMYADDNCQDLEFAMAVQHGACMPLGGNLWTMIYVDEDKMTTGIYTDSTCTTASLPQTTAPFQDNCQMKTKMYLSSAEEFAGNSQGVKGRTHFGRDPADAMEIAFAKTDVCLLGMAKITDSGTNVDVTMFKEEDCGGAGIKVSYDKKSCIALPSDNYFFCIDV